MEIKIPKIDIENPVLLSEFVAFILLKMIGKRDGSIDKQTMVFTLKRLKKEYKSCSFDFLKKLTFDSIGGKLSSLDFEQAIEKLLKWEIIKETVNEKIILVEEKVRIVKIIQDDLKHDLGEELGQEFEQIINKAIQIINSDRT